jgi:hypothetical protein
MDWQDMGGLFVPSSPAGLTGSISFTTQNAVNGSSYTVIMEMSKGVPQN